MPTREYSIEWYCRLCWQEGIHIESGDEHIPPIGWPDHPELMAAVLKQHDRIVRNCVGAKKCKGDLHKQERVVRRRPRKIKPPPLPDLGEPIIITRRGT